MQLIHLLLGDMQRMFHQIASLHVKMDTLTLEVRRNTEIRNEERISRTSLVPKEDNLLLDEKFRISSMKI